MTFITKNKLMPVQFLISVKISLKSNNLLYYFYTDPINHFRRTFLKPGEIRIKASAASDGLTISNSTVITVHCEMIIGDQSPSELIGTMKHVIMYLNFPTS